MGLKERIKNINGIWLPLEEEHLIQFKDSPSLDGGWTYQRKKLEMCLPFIKKFRVALDIGSHVGLWTRSLGRLFEKVHCFEPIPLHYECWLKNTDHLKNAILHPYPLGEKQLKVSFHQDPKSSGDTYVEKGDGFETRTLDSLQVDEERTDFIKIDCEGYEYFILNGAERVLKENKPCVIVEQKPGKAQKYGLKETQAVDYLMSLGAKTRCVYSGDFVLSWD